MRYRETPIKIEEEDNFQNIFTKYGALALAKQDNLSNLIGETEGELDIDNALLSFSDNIEFPIEVIGTLANDLSNWSWAWDNNDIFPQNLIKKSIEMKKIGEKYNIPQLTNPIFKASLTEAHMLAMVFSSLIGGDGYYVVNFGDLLIFVSIKSNKIPFDESPSKFCEIYNSFQRNYEVMPKLAFEAFTKLRGYEYKEKDDFSLAKIGDSRIIVGFSERGKVTHIQVLEA